MNKTKIDYQGKNVYVGIDVHKAKYVMTARCDEIVVKKASCPAKPDSFVDSLLHWFKGAQIKSAYEAGFSGFGLHRKLVAAGIENIVVNPSSIEVAANDRVKTDKRDATKVAEQLNAGRLKCIYIPTTQEEISRQLSRTRDQLVNARSRVGNQIKSKLYIFSLIDDDSSESMSNAFLKKVENMEMPADLKFCIDILINQWRQMTMNILKINKEMAAQAARDSRLEKVYRSTPGVGPVSSRILSTELGDMSRFGNIKSLFSYTGLTPSEHSSGDKVRRGHISRQGNAWIRGVLIEVAWRAIEKDSFLRMTYDRIKCRRGGKIAIVAIARKLIGQVRACFKNGEIFRIMPAIAQAEMQISNAPVKGRI